jgi:hypothetical protein
MNKVASLEKITVATKDEDNECINALELNLLTLLTGKNGTGKTFYLVSSYVLSEVALLVVMGLPEQAIIETTQFITDSCYIKKLTGRIEGFFDTGSYLAIHLEDGKVTEITKEDWDKSESVRGVKYMSAAMRTFESIGQYLFSRKLLSSMSQAEMFMALCKNWRLYDVKHIEGMIAKMPITFDANFKEALKNFEITDDIVSVDVDLEKCDFFYTTSDSKQTYMRTLGSGHQSIFNMMIGQL